MTGTNPLLRAAAAACTLLLLAPASAACWGMAIDQPTSASALRTSKLLTAELATAEGLGP